MAAADVTLHLRGSLTTFLRRLDTPTGFAFFVLFWLLTWIATRVGLRQAGAGASSQRLSPDDELMATTIAGGWNGLFVLAVLAVGFFVALARTQGIEAISALPAVLFGFVLGGAVAFATGAIAGLIYGAVDIVVLLVSGALFRWVSSENP